MLHKQSVFLTVPACAVYSFYMCCFSFANFVAAWAVGLAKAALMLRMPVVMVTVMINAGGGSGNGFVVGGVRDDHHGCVIDADDNYGCLATCDHDYIV